MRAHQRIHHLLATPAAVRFVSCEPLLEEVDLRFIPPHGWHVDHYDSLRGSWDADDGSHSAGSGPRIDWVIIGGESGSRDRWERGGLYVFFIPQHWIDSVDG